MNFDDFFRDFLKSIVCIEPCGILVSKFQKLIIYHNVYVLQMVRYWIIDDVAVESAQHLFRLPKLILGG